MASLQDRLNEAEAAYHALQCGQAVAEVRDQNGESIRYTTANAYRLLGYIQDLRRQLGLTTPSYTPMRVIF